MGEIVTEMVERELADAAGAWTGPDGLLLQQQVLAQADRYNCRRAAAVVASITGMTPRHLVANRVPVTQHSPQGRHAGLRLDSVEALKDALGLGTAKGP